MKCQNSKVCISDRVSLIDTNIFVLMNSFHNVISFFLFFPPTADEVVRRSKRRRLIVSCFSSKVGEITWLPTGNNLKNMLGLARTTHICHRLLLSLCNMSNTCSPEASLLFRLSLTEICCLRVELSSHGFAPLTCCNGYSLCDKVSFI